jgi:hypothetical protein
MAGQTFFMTAESGKPIKSIPLAYETLEAMVRKLTELQQCKKWLSTRSDSYYSVMIALARLFTAIENQIDRLDSACKTINFESKGKSKEIKICEELNDSLVKDGNGKIDYARTIEKLQNNQQWWTRMWSGLKKLLGLG